MSSNIKRVLDINTGHLRPRDIEKLNEILEFGKPPFRIHEYEYGFVVAVGTMYGNTDDAIVRIKEIGLSDEFVRLMQHAHANEAMLIQFDTDADIEPGFPIFDPISGNDITSDFLEGEPEPPRM